VITPVRGWRRRWDATTQILEGKTMNKHGVLLATVAILAAVAPRPATPAESYPSHAITFIVPFAPGGPTDVLARTMAERIGTVLHESIVVENVAGAGGSVGVGRAAHASADGYTISVGNWSTHVLNGAIYPLAYDLVTDLQPVAPLPAAAQLIVSRKDLPASTLAELVAWLKTHQATVGTAGVGSAGHVAAMLFQKQTGVQMSFVHYRGAGPAMTDLVGGHIDLLLDQASNSLPQLRSGTIKAYAVTSPTRLPAAPDIPTVDEAGVPNFYVSVWHGLWAPKGTPAPVVGKLSAAVREALSDPALRQRFAALGQDVPQPGDVSPERLAAVQKAEIDKWWPIVKAANIKGE
jgi:tripartite-type tricarboxylate transporter receptor subunit TctC